ncbi:MAG: hypothetical protein R3F40_07650 [Candidatus Competibacteraceae bacterium]
MEVTLKHCLLPGAGKLDVPLSKSPSECWGGVTSAYQQTTCVEIFTQIRAYRAQKMRVPQKKIEYP